MNSKKIKNPFLIGIPLLFIPILSTSLTLDPDLLIKYISTSFFVIILFVLFAKQSIICHFSFKPVYAPFYFYSAFIVYSGIHVILFGNNPDGYFEWFKSLLFFLLFFFSFQLFDFKTLKTGILNSLAILSSILIVYSFIEILLLIQSGKLSIPESTYQIKTFFGHRNMFVQILFFTIPFLVFKVVGIKRTIFQLFGGLIASAGFFILIIISNRAAWIALLFSIVVLFVMNLILKNKQLKFNNLFSFKIRLLFFILPLIIVFSAFLFFGQFTGNTDLETHASGIVDVTGGSTKDRLELWNRTQKLIDENTIFGCGLANWKIEVLKYGSKDLISEDNKTFYQRPHNDFLWIFAELGIIGFLLFATLLLSVYIALIYLIINETEISNLLFLYAILFAISGFLIFSFFSFPRERIEHNFIMAVFMAAIIRRNFTLKESNLTVKYSFFRIGLMSLIAILIIVASIIGILRFNSEIHLKKALIAKSNNNLKIIINEINKSESIVYKIDPTSTPLEWYKGYAYFQMNEIDSAQVAFKKAILLNPNNIHVLHNLASCLGIKDKPDEAIELYKSALAISPNFEEASLNLCALYYNIGEIDSAYQTISKLSLDSKNSKYKPFLMTILKSKLKNTIENTNDTSSCVKIPDNEDWYYNLHIESIVSGKLINIIILEKVRESN